MEVAGNASRDFYDSHSRQLSAASRLARGFLSFPLSLSLSSERANGKSTVRCDRLGLHLRSTCPVRVALPFPSSQFASISPNRYRAKLPNNNNDNNNMRVSRVSRVRLIKLEAELRETRERFVELGGD